MILNRRGNKSKLAGEIIKCFPAHDIYIEPFFGSGGLYFNKPKAKYNFLNDIDDDVYNLFRTLIDEKEQLVYEINRIPITETQLKEWNAGKRENSNVLNAVRFLVISNFSLYSSGETLRIGAVDPRKMILQQIDETLNMLRDAYFFNTDFRNVFKKCDYKTNIDRVFCYCDPPYLDTIGSYANSFTENDSIDLFNVLGESGVKWGMSEFDHPFIIEQAQKRNLQINYLFERTNLKNKRVEILITNYVIPQLKLF